MKKGWKTKTLEEICQFSNGLWKGEKPPFEKVGVIRNTNFTKEGTLDDSDIAYLEVEVGKLEKRLLQFGDIILEKSGGGPRQPVGRVVLFNKSVGKYSFSNFTAALRVSNPQELDFRFLHKFLYWTHLSGVTENMQSHSTGIRNLDGKAYKGITISFPPLPEQHRIVRILDEAFAGIATAKANAERNLENARAIFESYVESAFGHSEKEWKIKSLGELAAFRNGINFTKSSKGEPLKIVGVRNFQNLFWAPLDDLDTVTTDGVLPNSDLLKENDILFVRSNGNVELIGRTLLVGKVTGKISHSGFTIRARIEHGGVSARYLCHYLKSKLSRQKMIDSGIGTNIKSLNQVTLSNLVVPIPSEHQQATTINQIEGLECETQNLESIYTQKLDALDALKKSLLHQAFSGNL